MKLAQLTKEILIPYSFALEAGRSVGKAFTNWLILGFYIEKHKQKGFDGVAYGTNLLNPLGCELKKKKIPYVLKTSLKQYRLFYELYPQIRQVPPDKFNSLKIETKSQISPSQSQVESVL